MTVETLASEASLSAPVVAILLVIVIVLLCWRVATSALGSTRTRHAQRFLDLSIMLALVVFAVCVVVRFKLIG